MRYFKRAIAGILCVSMLLNTNGMVALAAVPKPEEPQAVTATMEDNRETVTETITEESSEEATEALTEEATEALAEELTEEATEALTEEPTEEATEALAEEPSEAPAEDVAERAEEESAENNGGEAMEEDAALASVLLNYLVIGEDYIELGADQHVLVGICDGERLVADAKLGYINETTGEVYEQKAAGFVDGDLNFELGMRDHAKGIYRVTTLTLISQDGFFVIDLAAIGVEAKFGVQMQADLVEPDLYMTDSEELPEEDNVVITTKDGDEITASDIGAAIDKTGTEMLKRAIDGSLIIVLDPGHGGSDGGAGRNGVVEKVVNLKIAQYCKQELDRYAGITTYMTRNSDVYVGLEERVAYAKSVGADVFISFHNNSSGSSAAHGAEVYYPNPSYNANIHAVGKGLASKIQNYLIGQGLYDRGIHTRDYARASGASQNVTYPDGSIADYYSIIRNSKMAGFPGLIIEHAFVSNEGDAQILKSEARLKELGLADAEAITEYFGLIIAPNTKTRYNGIEYKSVYNFDYYINRYPDIKKKYKKDPIGALRHFVVYGMKEGRRASEDFYVKYYKNRYTDLRNMYGNDLRSYYLHYMKEGKDEGRDGKTKCSEIQGSVTMLNGIDYSAVYNYDYYLDNYVGVKKKFKGDDIGALEYFVNTGMKKGQQASEKFDVMSYAFAYYDLRKLYKNDLPKYYMHYINRGKKEKRVATDVEKMKGGPTVYKGVNYKAVFNVGYYAKKYSSLFKKYKLDDDKYLKHFVENGMKEGRVGRKEFNVKYYRNRYPDLRSDFGNDLKKYYMHYIKKGKKEGRDAETYSDLEGYVTKYKGVDYKAVYDFNYYQEKYKDVKRKYGDDDAKTLEHFVLCGMKEGRQAKKSFDVTSYRYLYPDLRMNYRSDLTQYYLHYIKTGKKEGRTAIGVTQLQYPWTVYKGVDYSYVYDYYEFQVQYPTIAAKFGADDYGQLEYFVKNILQLTNIMGASTTNVKQMAAYYKSKATYPTFYASSDAPTIETFCQIYVEECQAEGVNAAVAFCQAMKETGFLRFGGQVSITQYNFAGVGATDNGAAGASFSSVREGVRAQVQHLKAYASKEPLKNPCVDPRFHLVTRGTAPFVEWLGISENPYGKGWATAKNYGYSILGDYMAKLSQY